VNRKGERREELTGPWGRSFTTGRKKKSGLEVFDGGEGLTSRTGGGTKGRWKGADLPEAGGRSWVAPIIHSGKKGGWRVNKS